MIIVTGLQEPDPDDPEFSRSLDPLFYKFKVERADTVAYFTETRHMFKATDGAWDVSNADGRYVPPLRAMASMAPKDTAGAYHFLVADIFFHPMRRGKGIYRPGKKGANIYCP